MEQIIVRVAKDGTLRYETKGFSGKSCMKASEFLLQEFGMENVQEEKKTSEFWEEESMGEHHSVKSSF